MKNSFIFLGILIVTLIILPLSYNHEAYAIISDGTVSHSVKISDAFGDLFRTLNLSPGDTFGFPLREIGDLDGDGNIDIVVGVPLDDDGKQNAGALYVLFMDTDGSAKDIQKISNSRGELGSILSKNDNFGFSIDVIGDLDGDGNNDLAVGAPGDDDGNENAGAVYILFLGDDGRVDSEVKLVGNSGEISTYVKEITSSADDAREVQSGNVKNNINPLSLAIENHPTINIVGTRFQSVTIDNSEQINSASVQFRALDVDNIGTTNVRIYGELPADDDADKFSNSNNNISNRPLTTAFVDWMDIPVWAPGEVSSDTTTPDLTPIIQEIVDRGGWANGNDLALIFFDHPTSPSDDRRRASAEDHSNPAPTLTIDYGINSGFDIELEKNEKFGTTVKNIGDIDSDGVDDLAIGSPLYEEEEDEAGAVYILLMNTDGTVDDATRIDGTEDPFDDNDWELEEESLFGVSIAPMGDVDGDGVDDIIVGSPGVEDDEEESGALFVLFLNNDGTLDDVQRISNSDGNLGFELDEEDNFGTILEVLNDYDGNGINEIGVGVPFHKDDEGAVYILDFDSDGKIDNSVKIADGSGGFTESLDDDYLFGSSIRNIGDLDGDGVSELVIGSPGDETIARDAGSIFILFMKIDGTVDHSQKITDGLGGFTGSLNTNDKFGFAINVLGDLDGDGNNDIAVGIPGDDTSDENGGAIFNLFLNDDGTVKTQQKITEGIGVNEISIDPNDEGGTDISAIGDLNGDGFTDFAVGLPKDDDAGSNTGSIYVVFTNPSSIITDGVKITESTGDFTENLDNGDEFGSAISFFNDLDGDGIEDIIVGAPKDNDEGDDTGAVYVLFMGVDGKVDGSQKITEGNGGFFENLTNKDEFGHDVSEIGDLDGDGVDDMVVGSPGFDISNNNNDKNLGAVYILFMNTDGTVKESVIISEGLGGFTGNLDKDDNFGHSVGLIGDLDDDGVTDIAVGAIKDDEGNKDTGAVYILFMNTDGTVREHSKIDDSDFISGTLDKDDNFGSFVSPIFDLNGDGIEDLMVGIARDDTAGKNTGALMTLFLDTNGDVLGFQKITEEQAGFDEPLNKEDKFGTSGTFLDLDGDSVPDYLIGAPFDDDGGQNSGAMYILFLNGFEENAVSITDIVLKSFENVVDSTITQTLEVIGANLNSREESVSMLDSVLKSFDKKVDESLLMESEGFNSETNKIIPEGVSITQLVLKSFEKAAFTQSTEMEIKAISSLGSTPVEIAEFVMEDTITILKHPENFDPIFDPPPGVIAEITCQVTSSPSDPTTEDDGESISFYADAVADCEFEANPCSRGCTISLEGITTDELSASGIENPLDVIFYEDSDEDGIFEDVQTFVIAEDPYSYLGITQASGTDFGLGESFPEIISSGGGGGDSKAPSYNTAPVGTEFPLVINGKKIDLSKFTTYLGQPVTVQAGEPVNIQLTLYDNSGPQNIQHVSMYMDIRGITHSVQQSNTFFIFENNEISGIGNKEGIFSNVHATSKMLDKKLILDFEITFEEAMDTSNIIVRVWDKQRNSMDRHVMNSIKVLPDSSDLEKDHEMPLNKIDEWAKYMNDFTYDQDFLKTIGIKEFPIPDWSKALGVYLVEGQISEIEFYNAFEYLSNNIQIDEKSQGTHYALTVKEDIGLKPKP